MSEPSPITVRDAAGRPISPQQTSQYRRGQPPRNGAGRMLDALLEVYPDGLTREELSEQAGVTASGGTFSSYLSMLRTAHLIDEDGGLVRAGGVLYLSGVTRS